MIDKEQWASLKLYKSLCDKEKSHKIAHGLTSLSMKNEKNNFRHKRQFK